MDLSKSSFAKLSGTSNYRIWSIKMKAYLVAQDLWDVVEITPAKAKATESTLSSQNSKAVSLIVFSCEDHILQLIDPNDLAVTIWRNLEKQYGHVGFSARHLAFQSLVSTKFSSCDNVDHYIDQFRSHINTLTHLTTQPLPQWLLLSILINNVGNQFEAWSQSIMQQIRSKTISEDSQSYLDEIIASLIDEARRTSQTNVENNQSTAMTARKGSKPKPICKHCGKIHKSDNCWEMFPEKRPSARFTSSNPEGSKASQTNQPSNSIAFLSHSNNSSRNSWILDSGATQHMCNNKSHFTNFESFTTMITIADNTKITATGKGNVNINTKDGNTFTLLDVLYVPQLASNLLSVCCAMKNPNIKFNFTNGKCEIFFDQELIATARTEDSLLVLETCNSSAFTSKSTDVLTWHKRLGHVNEEYLKKELNSSDIGKFSCDTCLKNKSTRIISRNQPVRSKRPLEKIHSDLAGPITPISLGGNKYVITFTDEYSRFSWVFLKNVKSGCLDAFKIFKKMVENEFNEKIAFLHCDNGGEYSSNEFKRFAHNEGIQLQYTVPYTPEQNGVAERLNRTLFNMARCFLNDTTNLNKSLWAELIKTACYIKNRLPSRSNEKFISPFEMLYHRKPSIKHLRIIGSKCFCHQTGRIIGKLEERSTQCFLVVYESDNIFRVFDFATNKVIRSRDVKICENEQISMKPRSNQDSIENQVLVDLKKSPKLVPQLRSPEQSQLYFDDNELKKSVTRSVNTEESQSYYDANDVPNFSPLPYDTVMHQKQPGTKSRVSYQQKFTEPDNDSPHDTSIDELADPKYDSKNYISKAFVAKCLIAANSTTQYLPETFEQAIKCEESLKWKISMRDEIQSIFRNTTWKLVPAPQDGSKVIQGRWVYRTKTNQDGKITKYKSRWVVKGFQQEEGFSFTDTFACVVKPMSYKILFSIAASQNLEIEQMDVKTAFLNSPIREEVYVEQPHGFELTNLTEETLLKDELNKPQINVTHETFTFPRNKKSKANLVCKLERALYGLKQAPRAWYETLSAFLQKINLIPLKSDYAVFVNHNRSLFIAVYVDDILIFGKNRNEIQKVKNVLQQNFDMTDMGKAHIYLGMQITRDRLQNTIYLDQQKYIKVVLERFNMADCNAVSTPMETGLKLSKRDDIATPQETQEYQKLIGCLEYAALATRPDITFAVHKLAQFASNPDVTHFTAAKRVLRYLKGSIKFGLVFKGNNTDQFQLFGYSDADWAGNTTDRKSIGGYCFYLNSSLISHISKKQKTIALSTAESETHAAVQATKEAIWLRNILEELKIMQIEATTIYCDNQAAIALSKNPEFHSRSKHVDIQYHFLRQHVDLNTVKLKFVGSDNMAADGLTKALSRYKHSLFCEFMQGKNVPADTNNKNSTF